MFAVPHPAQGGQQVDVHCFGYEPSKRDRVIVVGEGGAPHRLLVLVAAVRYSHRVDSDTGGGSRLKPRDTMARSFPPSKCLGHGSGALVVQLS